MVRASWHLSRLISATPKDGSLFARRGYAFSELKRWAEADSDYSQAIKREAGQDTPLIYYRRGFAREQLARWAEADSDYSQAIESGFNPDSPWSYSRRDDEPCSGAGPRPTRTSSWPSVAGRTASFGSPTHSCGCTWATWKDTAKPARGCWSISTRPRTLIPRTPSPIPAILCRGRCRSRATRGRLAERAVASGPKNWGYVQMLGTTLHRAGTLRGGPYTPGGGRQVESGPAGFLPWLALPGDAHDRLGHTDEARRWLDQAVKWIEREAPKRPEETARIPSLSWNHRLGASPHSPGGRGTDQGKAAAVSARQCLPGQPRSLLPARHREDGPRRNRSGIRGPCSRPTPAQNPTVRNRANPRSQH